MLYSKSVKFQYSMKKVYDDIKENVPNQDDVILPSITLCYSYFNQESALLRHVDNWNSWSKYLRNHFSYLIVDDNSSLHALEKINDKKLEKLDISIYRVLDDLHCNISGARNLAAKKCLTDWMMILDMDTLVSEELAEEIISLASNGRSGFAYKFNQRFPDSEAKIPHGAVCLIRVEDYWKVGGCEEDLVGHYGYTDPIFWYRAKGKVQVETKYELYLDIIREGHAKINRNSQHNLKLFESKKKDNSWSEDFIRFDWERVY